MGAWLYALFVVVVSVGPQWSSEAASTRSSPEFLPGPIGGPDGLGRRRSALGDGQCLDELRGKLEADGGPVGCGVDGHRVGHLPGQPQAAAAALGRLRG